MKIAASCRKDVLWDITGNELIFVFFDIDRGKIKSVSETPFIAGTLQQCADFLVKNEVDLLFTPPVSKENRNILDNAGIHLIENLCGNVRMLVEAYLAGVLFDDPQYFSK